mgnify:FL=1
MMVDGALEVVVLDVVALVVVVLDNDLIARSSSRSCRSSSSSDTLVINLTRDSLGLKLAHSVDEMLGLLS